MMTKRTSKPEMAILRVNGGPSEPDSERQRKVWNFCQDSFMDIRQKLTVP
jgi:hypothetical protein